jgi:geranylgeranylglycerol-phosphate geranylgeranyltransferase
METLAQKTSALLELTRPGKPIVAALCTLLGAYLGSPGGTLPNGRAFIAAAVVGLTTAFGLVINDCCDITVDRIGKPQRPIPSGRVSLGEARFFAWTLAGTALVVGGLLGPGLSVFAAGAIALSAAYSFVLKSTLILGNATVGLLVAGSLVYGALSVGAVTNPVWIAAMLSFPYMLAQEALFNLEDLDEDREAGLRTTATRLGALRTGRLVRAVFACVALLALVPWLSGVGSLSYLVAVSVCIVGPILGIFGLLREPLSAHALHRAVKLSRLSWVTSFLPLGLLK